MTEPKWEHDCDKDIFLGTLDMSEQTLDLYVAEHGAENTGIARYSSEGSHYFSPPAFYACVAQLIRMYQLNPGTTTYAVYNFSVEIVSGLRDEVRVRLEAK